MEKKLPESVVLFERDLQVLKLMALGLSVPELAEQLFVGELTAKSLCKRVEEKLGTDNLEEIRSYAKGLRLI
ncbi:LuxR C-terminal-related transcriptional regulator [Pedobacter heparinus]|uniref:LuxR C-terminal-related transcriptional regulator n=1 Tax=Pedobacter heparinus TaxID=984 RepID=UPI0029307B13|nr:LuxR C-terminal-related transcriptional regulator [Pedobacter heparinus]